MKFVCGIMMQSYDIFYFDAKFGNFAAQKQRNMVTEEMIAKAQMLDMNDYVQSGEGANGASYDNIGDSSIMVKLYNDDYPTETIFTELDTAHKVFELGIPSPEPGKLVSDGKRLGIMFRRIVGKRSYSRMLADEPERCEELAREFARCCRIVHTTVCPAGVFPDAKAQFQHLLEASKEFNAEEKKVLAAFIDSVPECSTALHGDMHFGNAISTLKKGQPITEAHDVYFIDLGYFAHGYPLFDLGMLQNICLFAEDDFLFHDFHIHQDVAKRFWRAFAGEYFFGPDKWGVKFFGPDADADVVGFDKALETVNKGMLPFHSIKMLLVEYNLGFMPPSYAERIRKTFGFN